MKIPKLPIDDKSKEKLLKSAGLLVGLIIVIALLSKWMTSGSKTLAQYAIENPDLAYGSTASAEAESGTSAATEPPQNTSVQESTAATDTSQTSSTKQPAAEQVLITNGVSMVTERTTYEPEFYYEPLSPELTDYITGISYPASGNTEVTYKDLCYVHVLHYDFNGEPCEGELISNQNIAQDLVEIFYELYQSEYQIEKIKLIDCYGGDDTASMEDNNTSCFNFRYVDDTKKLSKHALGLAIDINPYYNPYVRFTKEGGQIVSPTDSEDYADRSQSFPYKIDTDDLCYQLFAEHGFTWGGNWNSCKDYQHFQKNPD